MQCADNKRLLMLCHQAVQRADRSNDSSCVFWAHLSRALLAQRYQPLEQSREDLAMASMCATQVREPRAQRLLQICEASLWLRDGLHQRAFDRFSAMPLASEPGDDDPDDYFILYGMAQCAARLHHLEPLFDALYTNLRLTERTGPPVRHAVVTADLASALISIGRASEALELIDDKLKRASARWHNPLLLGYMRIQAAIAKYAQGRVIDAHNDFLALVHDGVADLSRSFAFQVHSNLMGICIQRGLHEEAIRSAQQARAAAGKLQRSAPLGLCHQAAGFLAHAQGDSVRAIHMLEQAIVCYEQDLPFTAPMNAHVDLGAVLSECHVAEPRPELAHARHRRFFEIHRRRTDYASRGQLAAFKARQSVAACIHLSDRERECLSWSSAGKTAWEVGGILGLSEWTVVYHIEKAKRKFGLKRKRETIAQAISLGLIKPYRGKESV